MQMSTEKKQQVHKADDTQPIRLYTKAVFTGYKRNTANQDENAHLVSSTLTNVFCTRFPLSFFPHYAFSFFILEKYFLLSSFL